MTFNVRERRTIQLILILAGILSSSATPLAAPRTKSVTPKARAMDSDLKAEHSFHGADVTGQYKSAPEGLVTVDADKTIDDLLKMRPNFKDRLMIMSEQR